MYGNPYNNQMYMQDLQGLRDRIDRQMQIVNQGPPQTTPITQNFQLATPSKNGDGIKYVENVDDVKKELVFMDSLFVSKDMKKMWLKDAKGDIRTFNIEEIIKKDEKDLEIEKLKDEINELKGMIKDAKHVASNDDGTTTVKKSKNVSNDNTSSE